MKSTKMLLFVTSVVLGGLSLLACLVCPLWAYAASRKWEAYLAQRNESVRKAARDAGRDSKPVVSPSRSPSRSPRQHQLSQCLWPVSL